jgi:hypothetical protein
MKNPFPFSDSDRHYLWDMLVERDIAAYCAGDWSMTSPDFKEQGFFGLHAHRQDNPDQWQLDFPSLSAYRDEWLRQASETASIDYAESVSDAIHRATTLTDIDIGDGVAIARKKFDGQIKRADGNVDYLNWQTLYFCAHIDNRWLITSFVGYMPYPMGK